MSGEPHTERARQNGFCRPPTISSFLYPWVGETQVRKAAASYTGPFWKACWTAESFRVEGEASGLKTHTIVPFFSQAVKGREVPMRCRMQDFFCATDQSPQHSFLFRFLAASVFVLQSGSHPVAMATFRLLTFQASIPVSGYRWLQGSIPTRKSLHLCEKSKHKYASGLCHE